MYKALARSHLNYCDLIYHIPPTFTQRGLSLQNLMEKVERIQYLAVLAYWNQFITHFEHLPTCDGFKKHLHSVFRPKDKSIFSLYDPDGLRILFQLRFGLHSLRSHRKHHNFADTPSDICICKQGVEDTKHFLISCPLFANHRDILQKNLAFLQNEIELYLYGHPLLIDPYNKEILLCTIN